MDADRVEFIDEPAIRSTVSAVFEGLNAMLTALLPEARIEHIGSTSIPGSVTKGDLDICVQVEQSAFPEADRILSERFARNVEYEFVVQPRLAGHGPTLFAGLSKHVDLKLVSRLEFASGARLQRARLTQKRSSRQTLICRLHLVLGHA